MKIRKYLNQQENKILEMIIALLINLIIFSTNNKLMIYTKHLFLLVIILCVIFFVLKKERFIRVNKYKILFSLFVLIIFINYMWFDSKEFFLDYSLYFIAGVSIIFTDFSKIFYYYLIKIFKIIFWIFIFSMFLEALIPNLFHNIFGFASFGNVEMRSFTSGGAIAGLAFEKAYAAFVCNLGAGIVFAEFITEKSYKYVIESIIILFALMMTGKRTLFIIPIIIILIFIIILSKKNKIIKLLEIGTGMTVIFSIAYTMIPKAALIFDRIFNNGGDILSGRVNFWNYAMEMFYENPIFGKGFMSFNDYIFNKGFRYYGERWDYQAHNVYVQLLGEIGIIGFTLIVLLIFSIIVKAIFFAKKESNFWNMLLVYWIVLFGIYSFTGNTLYYPCQMIIFILDIVFISNIKKIKNIPYKNLKVIKWK